MAKLSLRGISKGFGVQTVLQGLDLEVADGEFLSIVGPSGCGKSTLLRIVAGLEQHEAGEVHIGAERVDERLPSERDVAMVFQSYALYPHLTVRQNISVPLRYRRLGRLQRLPLAAAWCPGARAGLAAIDRDVLAVARQLDIEHLLERRPSQLSGGQRQRVALGRAIVRQPKLFLMDEPLSNLDAKLRTGMRAELAGLHRQIGTTFLYVTHDQVEAMTMSDRVAVMFQGRFAQIDTPERVYAQPATLAVAEFIGTPRINRLPVHCRDGLLDAGEGRPRLRLATRTSGPVDLCFRPEAAVLGAREFSWRGTVAFVEDMGAELHVHLRLDGVAQPVIVRASRACAAGLALGGSAVVGVERADLLLFGADGCRLAPSAPECVHAD
ncbi:MAG: ABC transporter ATP-binding protein [Ramlibacter sp.]